MKTHVLKKGDITKNWHIIDAEGQVLGRMSTKIASLLRGKHKPTYSPHLDCGDNVVVINAKKVHLTADKMNKKEYVYYTGYQSGQRRVPYSELLERKPEFIIMHAVKGMLGKNRLGAKQLKNLRVFAEDHDLNSLKFINA